MEGTSQMDISTERYWNVGACTGSLPSQVKLQTRQPWQCPLRQRCRGTEHQHAEAGLWVISRQVPTQATVCHSHPSAAPNHTHRCCHMCFSPSGLQRCWIQTGKSQGDECRACAVQGGNRQSPSSPL